METELFLFLSDVALEFPKSKIQEQDENTDSLCYTKECAGSQPMLLQILFFFLLALNCFTYKGQMKIVLD